MSLACSSAASRNTALQFYKTFYTWTRLTCAQSSPSSRHHHTRVVRTLSYPACRTYATARRVPSGSLADDSSTAIPMNHFKRQTMFVTKDDYATLTKDPTVLKRIVDKTAITFNIDPRDAERHRRFWLSGNSDAVKDACRQILALCTQTKSDPENPRTPITHVASSKDGGSVASQIPQITRTFTFPTSQSIHLDDLLNHAWKDIAAKTGAEHLAVAKSTDAVPTTVLRITGTKPAVAEAGAAAKAFLRKDITAVIVNDFKSAMRLVPAPVAVVTTLFGERGKPRQKGNRPGDNIIHPGWRGMTVSSFTSISLSPVPVISFNVRKPSRTLDALYRKGKFNLHVPTANALGKTIANAFTIPRDDPAETFFDAFNLKDVSLTSRSPSFLPAFSGPGIKVRYLCRLLPEKTVNIGDHDVIFAEVEEVSKFDVNGELIGDLISQSDAPAPTGLVYANGKYCLANEMTEPFLQPEVEQRRKDLSEDYFADAADARAVEETDVDRQEEGPEDAQRRKDLSEKYFSEAAESQLVEELDSVAEEEQYSETATTSVANTDLNPIYTPSVTTPAPSQPPPSNSFWSKQRPTTNASPLPDTTRRSMSTSTDKPLDAELLSTKVEDYVFQPFAPENKRRLRRLRTRLHRKSILDTALGNLEQSWQSGAMDGDSFKAAFSRIAELRRDVIDNEVDEDEFREFIEALAFGMSEASVGDRGN